MTIALYFLGAKKHEHGVGIMLTKKARKALMGYVAVSEWVLMVKLHSKPFNMVCTQVYAPTGEHSDSEVEIFYEDVKGAPKQMKKDDIVIL